MTDRRSQLDIELDAIDEAHAKAIGAVYVEFSSYAKGAGEGAKTSDEAKNIARIMLHHARKNREAAIELVNEEASQ